MKRELSQVERFIVFGLNTTVFYSAYWLATDSPTLTSGPQSVWFFAAIAWWILSLVSAPWFRPPRDALAGSVASLALLLAIDLPRSVPSAVRTLLVVSTVYVLLVIIVAVATAIAADRPASAEARSVLYTITGRLSTGSILFGAPALVSVFGFYGIADQILIVVLWGVFALVEPVELVVMAVARIRSTGSRAAVQGRVRRIDSPGIARVSLEPSAKWSTDDAHLVVLADGSLRSLVPMYTQPTDDGVTGTGLVVGMARSSDTNRPRRGEVYLDESAPSIPSLLAEIDGVEHGDELVGVVVEGSEIGEIRVELGPTASVRQGSVLACTVDAVRVYYQVLDAVTHEESFWQNPRGVHIVSAVQLGVIEDSGRVLKHPWLPDMNSPVFLKVRGQEEPASSGATVDSGVLVGSLDGLGLNVVADVQELLTYHAAVLGVTGTGKTVLTFDIIEAALSEGVKVVCVDLTGEYRDRLEAHQPIDVGLTDEEVATLERKLLDVDTGTFGAPAEKAALDAFLAGVRSDIANRVHEFLGSDDAGLALVELAEISNTRATLRATEMILSQVMLWSKSHRGEQRVLVVLEEAHTIIPETRGAGFDFDTQWVVGRIGQIALQGRKFGVGLLIVSQRTALVSKSVLSQCNTVFVFSLVDQTSLSYLENVLGREHVKAIPHLGFLELVAAGKAIRSERPVLLRRSFIEPAT